MVVFVFSIFEMFFLSKSVFSSGSSSLPRELALCLNLWWASSHQAPSYFAPSYLQAPSPFLLPIPPKIPSLLLPISLSTNRSRQVAAKRLNNAKGGFWRYCGTAFHLSSQNSRRERLFKCTLKCISQWIHGCVWNSWHIHGNFFRHFFWWLRDCNLCTWFQPILVGCR